MGSRLWPLSRSDYPKQFAVKIDQETLFQSTLRRFTGPGFSPALVITSEEFRFLVKDQWDSMRHVPTPVSEPTILIEPQVRGTAPAVLAAVLWCLQQKTSDANQPAADPLVLITPCDHAIAAPQEFRQAVLDAVPVARDGAIVCFGIIPDHASTAYGWIEIERSITDVTPPPDKTAGAAPVVPGICPIKTFIEKPALADAKRFYQSSRFFWNAGVFLGRASVIKAAFADNIPDLMPIVRQAVHNRQQDLAFWRLGADFLQAEEWDFNRAIMERIPNRAVMPYTGSWTDLGDWTAFTALIPQSSDTGVGVSDADKAVAVDCRDSVVYATGTQRVLGIGLKDTLVVAEGNMVLVAHKKYTQTLGNIIRSLTDTGHPLTGPSTRVYRPWGWYESLILEDRFQVKKILVKPGGVLSLQSHMHRSEHWIVVSGTAEVTVGKTVQLLGENQSVYVPLGVRHRLANPGQIAMTLIEIQTGSYFGEDDIRRYEDIYDRC